MKVEAWDKIRRGRCRYVKVVREEERWRGGELTGDIYTGIKEVKNELKNKMKG